MSPYIIAGLVAGLPLLLVLLLRVHASAFFISIVAGYLLAEFISDSAGLISSSFITNGSSDLTANLVVFFLPIALTLWFMRGTLPGRQMLLHLLPQVGNSLLILILLMPLLPENFQEGIVSNPAGEIFYQASDAIVAINVTLQLLLMIVTSHPSHSKKHKK